ncbi:MAG: RsmE family RNA methyltransferase [Vampirovibrionales bacterium]
MEFTASPTGDSKWARSARFVLPAQTAMPSHLPAPMVLTDKALIRHAATVLRIKTGMVIRLVHPILEQAYTARVEGVSATKMALMLLTTEETVSDGLPHITLMAALIKGQRWDWLLQKATELGVRTFKPLITQHTVVSGQEWSGKMLRWQEITKAAVEQCDGRFLPRIDLPQALPVCLKELPAAYEGDLRLVMMERGDYRQSLHQTLSRCVVQPSRVWLAVGPEGGLSDAEGQLLETHGFQPIQFGRRVLKAETAAIAGLSGLVSWYDRECQEVAASLKPEKATP